MKGETFSAFRFNFQQPQLKLQREEHEALGQLKEIFERQKERKGRLILRSLRLVLVVACGAYVAWTAINLGRAFTLKDIQLSFAWVMPSFFLGFLSLFLQFRAWWALVKKESESVEGRPIEAFLLYIESQLARYTPGKLGLPAVRIAGASRLGLKRRTMTVSILSELISWLGVGLLISALVVMLLDEHILQSLLRGISVVIPSFWFRILSLAAALSIGVSLAYLTRPFMLHPPWLQKFLGRFVLKSREEPELQPSATVRTQSLLNTQTYIYHAAYWLCLMLMALCVALALNASFKAAVVSAGALPVAILGGFFALFSPGGAGIREAIIASLSLPFLGATLALSFSLLLRAISLSTEVVLYLGLKFYAQLQKD